VRVEGGGAGAQARAMRGDAARGAVARWGGAMEAIVVAMGAAFTTVGASARRDGLASHRLTGVRCRPSWRGDASWQRSG